MRGKRWWSFIITLFILAIILAVIPNHAFAGTKNHFDKNAYEKIVKRNIGRIITGNIDVEEMLTDMEQAVKLGLAGCEKYMSEPETPQIENEIMKYIINNVQKMKSLNLDQIETLWHEGGFLKKKGIDISAMDHFSEVMCHYDSVVHPVTAIICLKQYMKTNDEDLLAQIKAELAEVKEHIKYLD